jgi:hypothetical protein
MSACSDDGVNEGVGRRSSAWQVAQYTSLVVSALLDVAPNRYGDFQA